MSIVTIDPSGTHIACATPGHAATISTAESPSWPTSWPQSASASSAVVVLACSGCCVPSAASLARFSPIHLQLMLSNNNSACKRLAMYGSGVRSLCEGAGATAVASGKLP
eukprot:TRINITY_DN14899_c0_g2_i2.p1 TRINITY_DN14899_c0_g2~~TRINITY_DN14899_c0_g2_i2.p1  ORF type:complete len:110 (+),score=10.11 TRINITY_DN14899_c0_g2_i2:308-637(+)